MNSSWVIFIVPIPLEIEMKEEEFRLVLFSSLSSEAVVVLWKLLVLSMLRVRVYSEFPSLAFASKSYEFVWS